MGLWSYGVGNPTTALGNPHKSPEKLVRGKMNLGIGTEMALAGGMLIVPELIDHRRRRALVNVFPVITASLTGITGPHLLAVRMPSIKWHHVWGQPVGSLKIIALATFSSVREILVRLVLPFQKRTLPLRNALARIWLGTSFAVNPSVFYSAPLDDTVQHVEENNLDFYIVPSLKDPATQLRDADAVVLFAHGGGMIMGHPLQYLDEYRRWVQRAKELGRNVVFIAVKYRVFPFHLLCRLRTMVHSDALLLTSCSAFHSREMASPASLVTRRVSVDSRSRCTGHQSRSGRRLCRW